MNNAIEKLKGKTPEAQEIIDGAIAVLDAQGLLEKFDHAQKTAFIMACAAAGYNPLLKQAYPVAYRNKDTGGYNLGVIFDYKVFLSRAEMSGKLAGWETSFTGDYKIAKVNRSGKTKDGRTYNYMADTIDPTSTLEGTITIYRSDWEKPFKSRPLKLVIECQDTAFWIANPVGMLEKQLIRTFFPKIFPLDCGRLPDYSEEVKASPMIPEYEVMETPQKPKADKIVLAKMMKLVNDTMDSFALSGRDREKFRATAKAAYDAEDEEALQIVIDTLVGRKEAAEEKAMPPQETAPIEEPTPTAEPAPDPVDETPEPVTSSASESCIQAMEELLNVGGYNVVHVKNSIKKHLGIEVDESESWTTAIIMADDAKVSAYEDYLRKAIKTLGKKKPVEVQTEVFGLNDELDMASQSCKDLAEKIKDLGIKRTMTEAISKLDRRNDRALEDYQYILDAIEKEIW